MNLKELKERVDFLYAAAGESKASNLEVVITVENLSIGGRAKVGIKGIYRGIDWEINQVRIDPEVSLYKEVKGDK